MKLQYLMTIFALFTVLFAVGAQAAITLGGDNFAASNLDEDDYEDDYEDVSVSNVTANSAITCTISNLNGFKSDPTKEAEGNTNITVSSSSVSVSQTSATTFTFTPTTTTASFKVTGRIPETLDAVNSNNEETAFAVASISCTQGASTVYSNTITMQRENQLLIDSVELDSGDTISDDGDSTDEISPGEYNIDIFVENQFRENDDIDFEDVDVVVECEESDIDLDADDTISINSGETESANFDFEISGDASSSVYTCTVTVSGEDSYGALHGETWDIEFDVEKEEYNIAIKEFTVTSVTCENRDITLTVRAENMGDDDDDEVKIEVISSGLKLSDSATDIDLEEGETVKKIFNYIVPGVVKAGTYDVTAKTYNLGSALSNYKTIKVVVPDCTIPVDDGNDDTDGDEQPTTPVVPTNPPTTVNPPTTTTTGNNQPTTPPTTTTTTPAPTATSSSPFAFLGGNSIIYVALLALLIIIVLAAVIGLIVFLLK